jgi:hypothetical protein
LWGGANRHASADNVSHYTAADYGGADRSAVAAYALIPVIRGNRNILRYDIIPPVKATLLGSSDAITIWEGRIVIDETLYIAAPPLSTQHIRLFRRVLDFIDFRDNGALRNSRPIHTTPTLRKACNPRDWSLEREIKDPAANVFKATAKFDATRRPVWTERFFKIEAFAGVIPTTAAARATRTAEHEPKRVHASSQQKDGLHHRTKCIFWQHQSHSAAIRYQAVPSLAIAQLREPAAAVMVAKRLVATTVFGVVV